MIDERRRSKRGRKPLPVGEKRMHTVSVRLSAGELELLDTKRGRFRRGEWLRMASLDKIPRTVPAMNAKAYQDLRRVAASLNQIAKAANLGGRVGMREFQQLIDKLRLRLVGAWNPADDGERS